MRTLLVCLALLACLAVAVPAAAQSTVSTPSSRTIAEGGPTGRFLIDGTWLFRRDPSAAGQRGGWHRQTGTAGWLRVTVPNAWNANETSAASMRGTWGWYRKDFRLPDARGHLDWVVRFESVNHRAKVWLNGREVGGNRGAYLPFELRLPRRALRRGGVNRLVVRVENRRRETDLPPSGFNRTGVPRGGWWNYGGLLREVYLRRVDTAYPVTVQVIPRLPCRTCTARVDLRVRVRNLGRRQRLAVTARFGGRAVRFRSRTVRRGATATFRGRVGVPSPRLWSPARPALYPVTVGLRSARRALGGWTARSGIRSVKVRNGYLYLNDRRVNFRGVGIHEDAPGMGLAIDSAARRRIVADTKELGATLLRAHYPLHPHLHELADREGLLVWSEVPVYGLRTATLKRASVRRAGVDLVRRNVLANNTHPSIVTWSVGNELPPRANRSQADYLRRAERAAKALDRSRPVSYAFQSLPSAGCQRAYGPIDLLGVNEYFGWYPGQDGQLADRSFLPGYLDSLRRCYRGKAMVVSEFGAEANRSGPVEEKGTYEFQQDFVNWHHGVFATKPWLSGVAYWTLREFKVRPEWDGGNPRPNPPMHQKGLISYDGSRKPAFFDVQRLYRGVQQYPGG